MYAELDGEKYKFATTGPIEFELADKPKLKPLNMAAVWHGCAHTTIPLSPEWRKMFWEAELGMKLQKTYESEQQNLILASIRKNTPAKWEESKPGDLMENLKETFFPE